MSCPICGRPTEKTYRPFCSKRCADRDLGKWLSGSYAIPAVEVADDEDIAEAMREAGEDKTH